MKGADFPLSEILSRGTFHMRKLQSQGRHHITLVGSNRGLPGVTTT
jgi:hypothetical protein